jgi:hypothetical protein
MRAIGTVLVAVLIFPLSQLSVPAQTPRQSTRDKPIRYRNRACPPQPEPHHEEGHTGWNVAIGVGAGVFAGLLISSLSHAKGPENKLSDEGPQFPATFHMSAFKITGFVEGGWPLVIDYETEPGTYAVIDIVTQGNNYYSVFLPTERASRQIEILQLPLSLGNEAQIADFTVRATVSEKDDRLRYFRIYGIGCGTRP